MSRIGKVLSGRAVSCYGSVTLGNIMYRYGFAEFRNVKAWSSIGSNVLSRHSSGSGQVALRWVVHRYADVLSGFVSHRHGKVGERRVAVLFRLVI